MQYEPRLRVALTTGDPSGIGPEIILRVLRDRELLALVQPVVYGDQALLRRVAARAAIAWPDDLAVIAAGDMAPWPLTAPAILLDEKYPPLADWQPGRVQAEAGEVALRWVRRSVADAMAGRVAAITTGPINKQSLALAGCPHPGHTELLAELTGGKQGVMMFVGRGLAVSLATIHIPLAEVTASLSVDGLLPVIRLTEEAMRRRYGGRPSVAVLGLNPHGGEGGRFGETERTVIMPAIAAARQEGLSVTGPLVPDTAFLPVNRDRYAAFVAMYHDQGLIPFKMLAFDHGVNVTLGLPIIRTSVDHGTAFDIAWQGKASADSMQYAIKLALQLARDAS